MAVTVTSRPIPSGRVVSISAAKSEPSLFKVAAGLMLFSGGCAALIYWDKLGNLRPIQQVLIGAEAGGALLGGGYLVIHEVALKKGPFETRAGSTEPHSSSAKTSSTRRARALRGLRSKDKSQARRAGQALQALLKKEKPDGVSIVAKGNNTVFTVEAIPGVVFKAFTKKEQFGKKLKGDHATECNDKLENRWKNIRAGRKHVEKRPRLIIPDAKLLYFKMTVKGKEETRGLLACEKYDVSGNSAEIELDYLEACKNPEFKETMRQLIGFIEDSGYCDVCFRNNPIYWEDGIPHIILLDLEFCGEHQVRGGLWRGDHGARGLCRHLTPDLAEKLEEHVSNEKDKEGWQTAIRQRKKELKERKGALNWYKNRGITEENSTSQTIKVKLADLPLDKEQQELAGEFIKLANERIKGGNTGPLWARRKVDLKKNHEDFPFEKMEPVITALKDAGVIFGFVHSEDLRRKCRVLV